jgi:hypothetical protein
MNRGAVRQSGENCMTREPPHSLLTDEQRRSICTILSAGCDRETATNGVGCSLDELRREMTRNHEFAIEVRRAEAACELTHMQNVRSAAREDKNWRASVWWLERRAPERYGRRDAGVVTTRQLESFLSQLVSTITAEVHDDEDRVRLVARLQQIVESLEQMSDAIGGGRSGTARNNRPQPTDTDSVPMDVSGDDDTDLDEDDIA